MKMNFYLSSWLVASLMSILWIGCADDSRLNSSNVPTASKAEESMVDKEIYARISNAVVGQKYRITYEAVSSPMDQPLFDVDWKTTNRILGQEISYHSETTSNDGDIGWVVVQPEGPTLRDPVMAYGRYRITFEVMEGGQTVFSTFFFVDTRDCRYGIKGSNNDLVLLYDGNEPGRYSIDAFGVNFVYPGNAVDGHNYRWWELATGLIDRSQHVGCQQSFRAYLKKNKLNESYTAVSINQPSPNATYVWYEGGWDPSTEELSWPIIGGFDGPTYTPTETGYDWLRVDITSDNQTTIVTRRKETIPQ